MVIWFHAILSNTHNFDMKLFNVYYNSERVDMEVMAMKGYASELQNWNLISSYSLLSYPGHNFFLCSTGFKVNAAWFYHSWS